MLLASGQTYRTPGCDNGVHGRHRQARAVPEAADVPSGLSGSHRRLDQEQARFCSLGLGGMDQGPFCEAGPVLTICREVVQFDAGIGSEEGREISSAFEYVFILYFGYMYSHHDLAV